MPFQKEQSSIFPIILIAATFLLGGCLTSKKIDDYVGNQFNNQLPKEDKNKNTNINIISITPYRSNDISITETKTSNVLPLVFYWQWDYNNTCTLNPAIGVSAFSKSLTLPTNIGLNQKLNGQKLELTIEQMPNVFAIHDKSHMVWFIYGFGWENVFIQPDLKDLIISYKVLQNDTVVKSGKISIKNSEHKKNLRYFQSWKSATSEYLTQYKTDIASMTKAFVNDLIQAL
jgi:hypothetical protein